MTPPTKDTDKLSERLRKAIRFAQDWLWKSKDRATVHREWDSDLLKDTANIAIAYSATALDSLQTQLAQHTALAEIGRQCTELARTDQDYDPCKTVERQLCESLSTLRGQLAEAQKQLFNATASLNMCVGAAGVENSDELCGWIDDKQKQLAAKDADIERMNKCCAEMRDAITTQINGLDIDGYIAVQFPAAMGHIPLREWFKRLWQTTVNDCGKDYLHRDTVAKERELLRYVAYQRLPLGDTVFEHLPEHIQRQVAEAFGVKP